MDQPAEDVPHLTLDFNKTQLYSNQLNKHKATTSQTVISRSAGVSEHRTAAIVSIFANTELKSSSLWWKMYLLTTIGTFAYCFYTKTK